MARVDGSRWRARRVDCDFSQKNAAAFLKMAYGSLRSIELIEGRPVSERVIKRAARLYQCSPEWLKGMDVTPPAPPTPEPAKPAREPKGEPTAPAPRPDRTRTGPRRADLKQAS